MAKWAAGIGGVLVAGGLLFYVWLPEQPSEQQPTAAPRSSGPSVDASRSPEVDPETRPEMDPEVQARDAPFLGAKVTVIYTPERHAEALEVQELVSSLGAEVRTTQTDSPLASDNRNSLWYYDPNDRELAASIQAALAPIQPLRIERGEGGFPLFNIWLTE